jgi:hypothetical protein
MEVDLAAADLKGVPAVVERDHGNTEGACVEGTGRGDVPHRKDNVIDPIEIHPVSSLRLVRPLRRLPSQAAIWR